VADAGPQPDGLLEALRWLFFQGRRYGMLGRAERFTGLDGSGGQADLVRAGKGWRIVQADRTEDLADTGEALRAINAIHFRPRQVFVVPELAPLLFQTAVAQAEESLNEYLAAWREQHDLSDRPKGDHNDEGFWMFFWTTHHQDKAVQSAITAIILSVSAAEAQANEWAELDGGWKPLADGKHEDRLPLERKCQALAARKGVALSVGEGSLQDLAAIGQLRDSLVHSKARPEPMPLSGSRVAIPGYTISVDARRACLTIRLALVEVAKALEVPAPQYLAFCPLTDPEDVDAWSKASGWTGMRDDPDFPPLSTRAEPTDTA
jgi:hypothetical protein